MDEATLNAVRCNGIVVATGTKAVVVVPTMIVATLSSTDRVDSFMIAVCLLIEYGIDRK